MILRITGIAFGGEGIAVHDGKTCFVQGALPGETVEAEGLQEKKSFSRAKTVRVLEASPHRVKPPCIHYGFCGGCQYQHVSYEAELSFKEKQVGELLQRIAGIQARVLPIIHSEKEYGYRNSVTFRVTRGTKSKHDTLSFIAGDNVSRVAVKHCDILDGRLTAVLKNPLSLKNSPDKISFKLGENGGIVSDEEERFFRVRLAGEPVIANSKGFFQANLRVTELLSEKVKEWLGEIKPRMFFDLYAGVGTFSWLCAKTVPRIFCVEENPFSVAALRMNREEKRRDSLEIVEGRTEDVFPSLWARSGAAEAVVLMDPPRQGLEKGLAGALARLEGAKALVYISCDIATLARDLKIILSRGRFVLDQVVPFDMFPRTKHIEVAALLLSC